MPITPQLALAPPRATKVGAVVSSVGAATVPAHAAVGLAMAVAALLVVCVGNRNAMRRVHARSRRRVGRRHEQEAMPCYERTTTRRRGNKPTIGNMRHALDPRRDAVCPGLVGRDGFASCVPDIRAKPLPRGVGSGATTTTAATSLTRRPRSPRNRSQTAPLPTNTNNHNNDNERGGRVAVQRKFTRTHPFQRPHIRRRLPPGQEHARAHAATGQGVAINDRESGVRLLWPWPRGRGCGRGGVQHAASTETITTAIAATHCTTAAWATSCGNRGQPAQWPSAGPRLAANGGFLS